MKKTVFSVVPLLVFAVSLIVIYPEKSVNAVKNSLVICGSVLIPSLFPITVCVLMLSKFLNGEFFIFLLSLLGGYPLGAKLIDSLYLDEKIEKRNANLMQLFCVNGGAGFIIIAVGFNIFGSKQIGYILYFSHILPSLIAFLIYFFRCGKRQKPKIEIKNNFSDIFVNCVADSSDTMLKICGFVVAFSVVMSFSGKTFFSYFLEITTALSNCKNIVFASFLLGFGGISIWFQIISVSKNAGINLKRFIFSRIMHGGFSAIITYLLLKVLKPEISVFSNNISIIKNSLYGGVPVAISVFILIILLIISLEAKNRGGNLSEDLLK